MIFRCACMFMAPSFVSSLQSITLQHRKSWRICHRTCHRKAHVPQTHLISPLVHAGVGPFPASAVRTFCHTARVHSHPTLTKRGQTQRMSSGQLRRLFRWSLWLALASMPRVMAHSTAQLPGASVSCALWPSLVISALPGRDPFSNPFEEVMCQVIVCTFLR